MATVTITIETDNAAFEAEPVLELASVLDDLVKRVAYGKASLEALDAVPLFDSNGNTVGRVEVV